LSDSLGGVTRYSYDAEDRVTSILAPWGKEIKQSYDSAGRPLSTLFPNGLEADLSFEARTGRLAGVAHRPSPAGAPILKFDHAYDIRGNLSALSELAGTKTFNYNKTERLTGARFFRASAIRRARRVGGCWANPPRQIESYSYDA
jgi:YD repeat-containing protein